MFAYVLVAPAMIIASLFIFMYVGYKFIVWVVRKLFNIKERSPHDYLYETLDKYNDSLI